MPWLVAERSQRALVGNAASADGHLDESCVCGHSRQAGPPNAATKTTTKAPKNDNLGSKTPGPTALVPGRESCTKQDATCRLVAKGCRLVVRSLKNRVFSKKRQPCGNRSARYLQGAYLSVVNYGSAVFRIDATAIGPDGNCCGTNTDEPRPRLTACKSRHAGMA